MRRYGHLEAYVPPMNHPAARKGLYFSFSGDNSDTLGRPNDRNGARQHAPASVKGASTTTAVWLGSGPLNISELCQTDCNPHV